MRLTLALLVVGFALGHGYILDGSCEPYKDLVINGMKGAFDLGQAAFETLQSPDESETPAAIAQQDLLEYMFLDAVLGEPEKWDTVKEVYQAVLKYNTNGGGPEATPDTSTYISLGDDEVVLFCDYSRYKDFENKDCMGVSSPGNACDTIFKEVQPMDQSYISCIEGDASTRRTTAWTFESTSSPPVPAIVQICPWYLEMMQQAPYKTFGDLGPGDSLAIPLEQLRDKLSVFPNAPVAMDIIRLFDLILLHELTHAIHSPPPTEDFGEGSVAGAENAYGWPASVRISSLNIINNADNYAYYGLGARMISPKEGGMVAQRPNRDGSVEILPAETKKREAIRYHGPFRLVPRDSNTTFLAASASMSAWASASASAPTGNIARSGFGPGFFSNTSTHAPLTLRTSTSTYAGGQNSSSSRPLSSTGTSTSTRTSTSNTSLSASKIRSSSSSDPNSGIGLASSHVSSSWSSLASTSNASNLAPIGSLSSTNSTPQTNLLGGTGIAIATSSSSMVFLLSKSSSLSSSSSRASSPAVARPSITTTVTSGTLRPSSITPPSSTSTSNSSLPLLWINWATMTPTTSSGVSLATHDSHGWPIIPFLHCWFCPHIKHGGERIGFVLPGIKGPGIIRPPRGVKPPPGFSINMPAITLDGDGNPTYESTEPTKSSSDSSCSTQTTTACDKSYSIFTPAGATTASTSTITLSCSTITACSADLTESSTTGLQANVRTPIADDFDIPPSWYDQQQSVLAAVIADKTDAPVTWSPNKTPAAPNATPKANRPPPTITQNTACVVTSVPDASCTCGPTRLPLITKTNELGTTFLVCGTKTTVSTIIPTAPNPTPTQSAHCYPTLGSRPILSEAGIDIGSKCSGKLSDWSQKGDGSPEQAVAIDVELYLSNFTPAKNAPADCKAVYNGGTAQQQLLCSVPFAAIIKDCPRTGGSVSNACGDWSLQTCPLIGACRIGDPTG